MNQYSALALALVSTLLMNACGGLSPDDAPERAFIRGTVTYVGGADSWPKDNVYEVLAVAFEEIPNAPDSVISAVLNGSAVISDTLLTYVDQVDYSIEIESTPRTFKYVVIAMRNGPALLNDWIMIAVYSPTNDPTAPGTVTVREGEVVTIDFTVDFNNLPPQPFE